MITVLLLTQRIQNIEIKITLKFAVKHAFDMIILCCI